MFGGFNQISLSLNISVKLLAAMLLTSLLFVHLDLKVLKDTDLVISVFKATVLSKLTYASQFWWGFIGVSDKERLEAFLRKSTRCNFYDGSHKFSDIAAAADIKLFNVIISNPQHVLYKLLPPLKDQSVHNLRNRVHPFMLPLRTSSMSDKNFIMRMLYKDCY